MPKNIKNGPYITNFDKHADVGTHWIALFRRKSEIVYFNSFGVEHVPEEIKEFIANKNIKANIFRIQANNLAIPEYFCFEFVDFMLAGKKFTNFTNLFSLYGFEKNGNIILSYLKMNEIDKRNLTDQRKFRLNEISKIGNYFNQEINQRKSCSNKSSKYAVFDYVDKILIVLSATSGGVYIISFKSVVGAPSAIAGASFTLVFSLTTGMIKKLLSIPRNKKKKNDKILMLAKCKLNSIETLLSEALIDMEISHEEFITILKEKDKYEKMKENVRNINETLEEKTEKW